MPSSFDKISHSHLLAQLGTFPAKRMIARWLRAGVFEAGKGFAPTEEGTPQGGVISPLLLNVALHGLEEAAGVRYRGGSKPAHVRNDSPVLIRYADDFVVCCHTRQEADGVREKLAGWLAERGLSFNEDKTRIVALTEGFDFLGWTFRRYRSGKLLITPSKAAARRHRKRLAEEMRKLRGSNAGAVIATLNPIIRGWTAYHRSVYSSREFSRTSHYMWKLTYKWARYSHPNKPVRWVTSRYFGKFCPTRGDKWVFGNRETGAYLLRHSWTLNKPHVLVKGRASPDDPDQTGYWDYRRRKHVNALDSVTIRLLVRQKYRCGRCGGVLLDTDHLPTSPEEWENWWIGVARRHIPGVPGSMGTPKRQGHTGADLRLIHASCLRKLKRTAGSPALDTAPP